MWVGNGCSQNDSFAAKTLFRMDTPAIQSGQNPKYRRMLPVCATLGYLVIPAQIKTVVFKVLTIGAVISDDRVYNAHVVRKMLIT